MNDTDYQTLATPIKSKWKKDDYIALILFFIVFVGICAITGYSISFIIINKMTISGMCELEHINYSYQPTNTHDYEYMSKNITGTFLSKKSNRTYTGDYICSIPNHLANTSESCPRNGTKLPCCFYKNKISYRAECSDNTLAIVMLCFPIILLLSCCIAVCAPRKPSAHLNPL